MERDNIRIINFIFSILKRLVRVSFLFIILSCAYALRKNANFEKDLIVYPNPISQYFVFGYKLSVADFIYLGILPHFDFCETENPVAHMAEQGMTLNKILGADLQPSRCHKAWVYQWTDLLTDLDPRFHSPYSNFGTVLSVLVNDREGARLIFEKGLSQFPNDWVLNYRAAYHYLYEMQNPKRAAELMMVSYKNGGPSFLPALAAQLYTRIGQAAFAKTFLEDFIQENPESEDLEQVQKRLREANDTLSK